MNLYFRRLLVALLMLMAASPVAGAESPAVNVDSIIDGYDHCVQNSDPSLVDRCKLAGVELVWPDDMSDPRLGPVYIDGGVFVCSYVTDELVLATTHPESGERLYLELYSPTACPTGIIGTPGIPLRAEIEPLGNPKLGPTSIQFSKGLDYTGVCSYTTGNLTVFRDTGINRISAINFSAPIWCSGTA